MKKRKALIKRNTTETRISLSINLDGRGKASIRTPIGFLNHMLNLLARHGLLDLQLKASGDTDVDIHHTNEDIGICLGLALKKQDKKRRRAYLCQKRQGSSWNPRRLKGNRVSGLKKK